MDRALVYTGALPQTIDVLNSNKFAMFALGYGMQMVLGTNTYVDGLACLPTSPTADLHVNVQVGSIYSLTQVDGTAYSDLGTDSSSIVKQGINPTVQVLTITPPGTGGQSQVFLVQAEYQDVDTGASVLSYFNAANPSAPFSGPANAGTSNNTIRQGKCTISLKAGVAAATGSQVTPSPDVGFVGLFAVTVANGQTQITSPNIVQLTTAPIVGANNKLPAIPNSVQSGVWQYGVDTSAGGSAVVTTAQTTTGSAVLTFAGGVPAYVATGMKVFDLTTVAAITGGQTVLSKTGTTVTMSANANATVQVGDSIAFSNNAYVASITPVPASLTTGMGIRVQAIGTNSGASTLNLNGLGAVAIHRASGSNLAAGDISANEVVGLVYDGSAWQIQNFTGGSGGGVSSSSGIPYGSDTSTSSNTITVAPSPPISSLAAGQPLLVKLANPILGATTINVSGQSAASVVSFTGQALAYGAGRAGEMLWLAYDGSVWQLVDPPLPLQANTTIYVNASTGSDSLDGTQATVSGTKGPLQHIQAAVNKAFNYPPSQFAITIQIADGTYNETVVTPSIPGPALIVTGNAGSPSNVVVNGQSGAAFIVIGANTMTVQNLRATSTASGASCFSASGAGASMTTSNTVSAACNFAVFYAASGGSMVIGSHNFVAAATYGFAASKSGTLNLASSAVFTISGSITMSAFAWASGGGNIEVPITGVPTFVNPGNCTGLKYLVVLNGVINSQGQGGNYFPGNSAGIPLTGGQYGV